MRSSCPGGRPVRSTAAAGLALALAFSPLAARAQSVLPTGGAVAAGAAAIRQAGPDMTVTQTTPRAIVNWNSFSVGQGNAVTFAQPDASSAILNRVTGSTTSAIAGQLTGNGQVYLVNPNGIAITKTGSVRVGGGFVASSLDVSNKDFMSGVLSFFGGGASAGVSNAGSIEAASGGFVALLGGTVANSGVITVPLGKVAMGSGEQATLNLTGDNFLQVAVPTGAKTADGQALVDVSGKVRAAGGTIQIKAATAANAIREAVNVPGSLSVASAHASGGGIVLSGGPGGNVAVGGRISASGQTKGGSIAISGHNAALKNARLAAKSAKGAGGSVVVTAGNAVSLASTSVDVSGATGGGAIRIGGDFHGAADIASAKTTTIDKDSTLTANATDSGNGGTVAVWSNATTTFAGKISATGGPNGGDGGDAEVSANPATEGLLNFIGNADLTAAKGKTGTLLIDPYDITIVVAAEGPGGAFSGGNPSSWVPTATSFIPVGTLTGQLADANVIVSTGLAGSPGPDAGNLTVATPIVWASANSLTLQAFGTLSFTTPDAAVPAINNTGTGGLVLEANGLVSMTRDITMTGGGVTVTGPTTLAANVASGGGAILFNNPVTLASPLGRVTVDAGAGTVTFGGTVEGGDDLSVTGGAVSFAANIGSVTPLAALSVTGPVTLSGNVTTADGSIFLDAVALGADVTLNSGAGTVIIGGAVDGAHALTVTTTGTAEFNGAIGATTPLTGLTVNGVAVVSDNVTTANGPIAFNGALELNASDNGTTIVINSGTAQTTFGGAVDSVCLACDGDVFAVGLTASAGAFSFAADGPFGSESALAAVSLTSPASMTLPAITAASLQATSTAGAVTLGGAINLTGTAAFTAANDIVEAETAAIVATAVSANSSTGRVVLTNVPEEGGFANAVGAVSGSAPLGFSFTDGVALSAGAITAANGSIFLQSSGAITQTGPLQGQALAAISGGDIVLTNPANAVGVLATSSVGASEFVNTGDLTIGAVPYFVVTPTGAVVQTTLAGVSANAPNADGLSVLVSTVGSLAVDAPVDSLDPTALVILAATGNFINNVGPDAIADPWQIYSLSPTGDFFNGLDSGNTAVWNTTYGQPVTAAGNRYIFAFQPTITVTSVDAAKTYGDDATQQVAASFVISGLQPGVPGAFLGDAAADVFSGAPLVTSPGSPAGVSVLASPFAITVAQGSFTVADNYTLALASPGRLTVDPRPITYAVADTVSFFGLTPRLGAATLNGVLPGDTVDPTVGAFFGAFPVPLGPQTPIGVYGQYVTALSNPNYTIAGIGNDPGRLTIFGSSPVSGFVPGLTEISNPSGGGGGGDLGADAELLQDFRSCEEPPPLPDPNRYVDADAALRAISQSLENYFRRCQLPTQETIADALESYAQKLEILAPRLPPALRNVPAIVAEGARRARAARTPAEAVAVMRQTIAAVHKEITLVLSEDPATRSREIRDRDTIEGALSAAPVTSPRS